ncbi:hypothetical protein [Streptomyces tagetis]|uniref:Uncharacterized protein n=1 Tax=Streptomyces tagetis TaxID=2820809 RepID=A0A940XPG0_9ACTN|nr:hypothetical protein [Streptomyces sp. RG38]MBQ0828620.1 hypothetical protein [Streptomyces sp. RG38]
MLRHEFQPGRLVAGACLLTAGVLFAGDAAGVWRVPRLALVPLVVGGLFLAGAVGMVAGSVRRRRRAARRDAPPTRIRT